jgi:hypothetical protein
MGTYWLIELITDPPSAPIYYTAPGTWGSAVDLATKFHTETAARAEAGFLRIPAAHSVVPREHAWCDA